MSMKNIPEHLEWSHDKLKEFLSTVSNVGYIGNYLKYMKTNIENKTQFIDKMMADSKITLSHRVKLILADIKTIDDVPKCKICGGFVTFGSKPPKELVEHCNSLKCSRKVATQKAKTTWDANYGGHPLSNKEILDKQKRTNLKRYGSENPNGNSEVREKIKNTSMKRYGVDNPSKSDEIKKKVRETIIERYGGYEPLIEKALKTIRERYGVDCAYEIDGVMEKVRQTTRERYGVDHASQCQQIREKTEKTNIERYGYRYHSMSPQARKSSSIRALRIHKIRGEEIVIKRQETSMKRYGVDNPSKSDEVKNKISAVYRMNYGVDNISQSDEIKQKKRSTSIRKHGLPSHMQIHISPESLEILKSKEKLESLYSVFGGLQTSHMLGVCDSTVYEYMKKHDIPIDETVGTSFAEREIASYIKSLVGEENVVTSDRTVLNGRELDIYIPSHNMAIEYNGLFWHSNKFKKPIDHLQKTRICEENDIRLIQIFEDEWIDRKETVKNSLKHRLGLSDMGRVYARKCVIVPVSNKEIAEFYHTNHIQGSMNASTAYALKYDDQIVAAMSFKENYGYMELTRFATSCQVVGGFGKLFKHFVRNHPEIKSVMSFADRRWSQGDVYYKNGFDLVKKTRPNYCYVQGQKRVKKQNFRHKHLKDRLKNYDPMLSEKQNTENNGIYRIYDCGLLKFEWTRD